MLFIQRVHGWVKTETFCNESVLNVVQYKYLKHLDYLMIHVGAEWKEWRWFLMKSMTVGKTWNNASLCDDRRKIKTGR